MTPDDPRHGSPAGFYAHRSEGSKACDPCDTAAFRYTKQWKALRSKGIRSTTPSAPVTEHIRTLEESGMVGATVLAASGVSRGVFYALRHGKYPRCRTVIADRILAVKPQTLPLDTLADGQLIPNVGCRRRIRALLALGWTHAELTQRSGVLTALKLSQAGDYVTADVHRKIAELYDALSMTLGPSERTRHRAAKWGYAPPLAWDEETIDDPGARPAGMYVAHGSKRVTDESLILRRMAGDRTAKTRGPESVEVVRRLLAEGRSQRWISIHTGLKTERYMDQIDTAQEPASIEQEEAA